eukprot:5053327-Prorocentrum_lima.AAC.1
MGCTNPLVAMVIISAMPSMPIGPGRGAAPRRSCRSRGMGAACTACAHSWASGTALLHRPRR